MVSLSPLPEPMLQALASIAPIRVGDGSAEALQGANILISTAINPVSAEMIASFPDGLGLIANIGVGTDNIDLNAAAASGIQVSNTPVVGEDTADLTFALLLAACRRLSHCESLLRAGKFSEGQNAVGTRVHGKTLGIVGFGSIGQAVARRATGFSMQVLYHGPNRKAQAEQETGASYRENLTELLSDADIVSLNCPLTPATKHLLNKETLAQMKPGAILINTGRGALVNESDLVQALAAGQLGGAGLDVFEFEPEVTAELLEFDNVTLLPHIGSATGECRQDMFLCLMANIRAYLDEGSAVNRCR